MKGIVKGCDVRYKKAMVVLVNNLIFFEYMMKNRFYDDDVLWVIFTDTRFGDKNKKENIEKIANKYKLNYKIFTQDKLNEKFIGSIPKNKKIEDFLNVYTMSAKFLAIWFVFKYSGMERLVLSDDDVVFSKDFGEIFNEQCNISQKCCFSLCNITKDNGSYKCVAKSFNEDANEYRKWIVHNKINSGQLYLVKDNICSIDKYEKILYDFFNDGFLIQKWYDASRKAPFCGSIDEAFLSCLIWRTKHEFDKGYYNYQMIGNLSKVKDDTIIKKFNNAKSCHLCAGKYKYELYNKFIDLGLIKGKKNNKILNRKVELYV